MRVLILSLTLIACVLAGCSSTTETPPETTTGTLDVIILPPDLNPSWSLEGPAKNKVLYTGDQTVTDLEAGDYTLSWLPVLGYDQPDPEVMQVTIVADSTVEVVGTYQIQSSTTASVVIDVTPDVLSIGWTLKIENNEGEYDVQGFGDRTVSNLPPGRFTVDWQPVPDWIEPDGGWTDGVLVESGQEQVGGTYTLRPSLEIEMIEVPGGVFTMGSQEWELGYRPPYYVPARPDNEAPRHDVTISRALLVSATEITQHQYESVTGENPSSFSGSANRPVETVTWLKAAQFCNALSDDQGLELAYSIVGASVIWNQDAVGYRLPTEAEWEYFCRAERDEAFAHGPITEPGITPDWQLDPHAPSDPVLDRLGWYNKNSGYQTFPVASKLPNEWGLYDAHGNVFEWCWDWYGDEFYTEDAVTDPTGPSTGSLRVLRGGSYGDPAANCRSALRYKINPTTVLPAAGFRVVRWANAVPPSPEKPLEKD